MGKIEKMYKIEEGFEDSFDDNETDYAEVMDNADNESRKNQIIDWVCNNVGVGRYTVAPLGTRIKRNPGMLKLTLINGTYYVDIIGGNHGTTFNIEKDLPEYINFNTIRGSVIGRNLTTLRGFPIKISGDFKCVGISDNRLTSLEGCPKEIGGNFNCGGNQLTSLEGSPEKVGRDFECYNNELTSLKGCPKEIGRNFCCVNNQLTSLEGSPEKINGNFDCYINRLTSLKGCPKEIDGCFNCYENQLKSLEGCPTKIGGGFSCYDNQLKSLEGCPEKIGGGFNCGKNQLTSLKGCPKEIGGGFNCGENQLKSLEGCPKRVNGDFCCNKNRLNLAVWTEKKLRSICKTKGDITGLDDANDQIHINESFEDSFDDSENDYTENFVKDDNLSLYYNNPENFIKALEGMMDDELWFDQILWDSNLRPKIFYNGNVLHRQDEAVKSFYWSPEKNYNTAVKPPFWPEKGSKYYDELKRWVKDDFTLVLSNVTASVPQWKNSSEPGGIHGNIYICVKAKSGRGSIMVPGYEIMGQTELADTEWQTIARDTGLTFEEVIYLMHQIDPGYKRKLSNLQISNLKRIQSSLCRYMATAVAVKIFDILSTGENDVNDKNVSAVMSRYLVAGGHSIEQNKHDIKDILSDDFVNYFSGIPKRMDESFDDSFDDNENDYAETFTMQDDHELALRTYYNDQEKLKTVLFKIFNNTNWMAEYFKHSYITDDKEIIRPVSEFNSDTIDRKVDYSTYGGLTLWTKKYSGDYLRWFRDISRSFYINGIQMVPNGNEDTGIHVTVSYGGGINTYVWFYLTDEDNYDELRILKSKNSYGVKGWKNMTNADKKVIKNLQKDLSMQLAANIADSIFRAYIYDKNKLHVFSDDFLKYFNYPTYEDDDISESFEDSFDDNEDDFTGTFAEQDNEDKFAYDDRHLKIALSSLYDKINDKLHEIRIFVDEYRKGDETDKNKWWEKHPGCDFKWCVDNIIYPTIKFPEAMNKWFVEGCQFMLENLDDPDSRNTHNWTSHFKVRFPSYRSNSSSGYENVPIGLDHWFNVENVDVNNYKNSISSKTFNKNIYDYVEWLDDPDIKNKCIDKAVDVIHHMAHNLNSNNFGVNGSYNPEVCGTLTQEYLDWIKNNPVDESFEDSFNDDEKDFAEVFDKNDMDTRYSDEALITALYEHLYSLHLTGIKLNKEQNDYLHAHQLDNVTNEDLKQFNDIYVPYSDRLSVFLKSGAYLHLFKTDPFIMDWHIELTSPYSKDVEVTGNQSHNGFNKYTVYWIPSSEYDLTRYMKDDNTFLDHFERNIKHHAEHLAERIKERCIRYINAKPVNGEDSKGFWPTQGYIDWLSHNMDNISESFNDSFDDNAEDYSDIFRSHDDKVVMYSPDKLYPIVLEWVENKLWPDILQKEKESNPTGKRYKYRITGSTVFDCLPDILKPEYEWKLNWTRNHQSNPASILPNAVNKIKYGDYLHCSIDCWPDKGPQGHLIGLTNYKFGTLFARLAFEPQNVAMAILNCLYHDHDNYISYPDEYKGDDNRVLNGELSPEAHCVSKFFTDEWNDNDHNYTYEWNNWCQEHKIEIRNKFIDYGLGLLEGFDDSFDDNADDYSEIFTSEDDTKARLDGMLNLKSGILKEDLIEFFNTDIKPWKEMHMDWDGSPYSGPNPGLNIDLYKRYPNIFRDDKTFIKIMQGKTQSGCYSGITSYNVMMFYRANDNLHQTLTSSMYFFNDLDNITAAEWNNEDHIFNGESFAKWFIDTIKVWKKKFKKGPWIASNMWSKLTWESVFTDRAIERLFKNNFKEMNESFEDSFNDDEGDYTEIMDRNDNWYDKAVAWCTSDGHSREVNPYPWHVSSTENGWEVHPMPEIDDQGYINYSEGVSLWNIGPGIDGNGSSPTGFPSFIHLGKVSGREVSIQFAGTKTVVWEDMSPFFRELENVTELKFDYNSKGDAVIKSLKNWPKVTYTGGEYGTQAWATAKRAELNVYMHPEGILNGGGLENIFTEVLRYVSVPEVQNISEHNEPIVKFYVHSRELHSSDPKYKDYEFAWCPHGFTLHNFEDVPNHHSQWYKWSQLSSCGTYIKVEESKSQGGYVIKDDPRYTHYFTLVNDQLIEMSSKTLQNMNSNVNESFDDSFDDNEDDYTDIMDKEDMKRVNIEDWLNKNLKIDNMYDKFRGYYVINPDLTIDLKYEDLRTDKEKRNIFSAQNSEKMCGFSIEGPEITQPWWGGGERLKPEQRHMGAKAYSDYQLPDYINFNICEGHFTIQRLGLTTLRGCPKIVYGNFNCNDNNLTTLDFFPECVGKYWMDGTPMLQYSDSCNGAWIHCSNNNLESLKGIPANYRGSIFADDNNIMTFEGCPEIICNISIEDNMLTSMKGAPKKVNGRFIISKNFIKSLNGMPKEISGDIRVDGNFLKKSDSISKHCKQSWGQKWGMQYQSNWRDYPEKIYGRDPIFI